MGSVCSLSQPSPMAAEIIIIQQQFNPCKSFTSSEWFHQTVRHDTEDSEQHRYFFFVIKKLNNLAYYSWAFGLVVILAFILPTSVPGE